MITRPLTLHPRLRQIFFIAYDFLDLLVAMGLGLIGMSTIPNVFYDTRGEGT